MPIIKRSLDKVHVYTCTVGSLTTRFCLGDPVILILYFLIDLHSVTCYVSDGSSNTGRYNPIHWAIDLTRNRNVPCSLNMNGNQCVSYSRNCCYGLRHNHSVFSHLDHGSVSCCVW